MDDGDRGEPPSAGAPAAALPGPEVVGDDVTADGWPQLDTLVELARATLEGEGVTRGRLDLMLVDPVEMAELNQAHMGHDGPTDVLAFPLDADEAVATGSEADAGPDGEPAPGPPLHLGDVIVCPAVARDQAPAHTGTLDAELTLLVVHGVLHVLGHDHTEPAETAAMQARERHHLARAGLGHPADRNDSPEGSAALDDRERMERAQP